MQNQTQKGDNINVTAPAGGVVSGRGYLIGTIFGISALTADQGDTVPLWLVGCYMLNKNAAEAWTVGQLVYWDNIAKQCTTTASTNTKIGVAIAAAANPSASGNVRLNGAF